MRSVTSASTGLRDSGRRGAGPRREADFDNAQITARGIPTASTITKTMGSTPGLSLFAGFLTTRLRRRKSRGVSRACTGTRTKNRFAPIGSPTTGKAEGPVRRALCPFWGRFASRLALAGGRGVMAAQEPSKLLVRVRSSSPASLLTLAYTRPLGAWRSLVAHPAGGRKVAGSNPVAPTNCSGPDLRRAAGRCGS
jgi:hypothetical protein